jgi:hypothetical protein
MPPQLFPKYRGHLHNVGARRKIEKFHMGTHKSRVAWYAHCNIMASAFCHANRQIFVLTPKELQYLKLKAGSKLT